MTNKPAQTKIILSRAHDPWQNLALEEYLLKSVTEGQVLLYLWQNENTVVIGRNQNAWKECNCKLLEQEGGKLARRPSGGGAVFHDLGNLNFTFVMDRKLYDLERQLEVILGAVRQTGISACFSSRNDLTVDGKKFSGNAFFFESEACFHHGTILVNTNFEKLVKYLQVSPEKIISKGIESVRSRVLNLVEVNPDITIDVIAANMRAAFSALYREPEEELAIGGLHEFHKVAGQHADILPSPQSLYEKYSSWEWRYGKTPKCDVTFQTRFPWGGIELLLGVDRGRVSSSVIYSDALDSDLIRKMAESLLGAPFRIDSLTAALAEAVETPEQRTIVEDVRQWLKDKNLP